MMDEYWTTRDGRQIAVGDMTEQHAKNCLRMILRRNREGLSGPDALDFYCAWVEVDNAGGR